MVNNAMQMGEMAWGKMCDGALPAGTRQLNHRELVPENSCVSGLPCRKRHGTKMRRSSVLLLLLVAAGAASGEVGTRVCRYCECSGASIRRQGIAYSITVPVRGQAGAGGNREPSLCSARLWTASRPSSSLLKASGAGWEWRSATSTPAGEQSA